LLKTPGCDTTRVMTDSTQSRILDEFRRAAALGLWTALGLLAAVIAGRALAGAMTSSLQAGWFGMWVIAVSGVGAFAGALLPKSDRTDVLRGHLIGWGISLIVGAAWLPVATAWQFGALFGVALIHGGLIFVEAWTARLMAISSPDVARVPMPIPGNHPCNNEPIKPCVETSIPETANQWMVRRDEEGSEICEGQMRVEFAAGEREVTLHVSFCPPLPSIPHVELEDLDGQGWDLKATAAYSYGIRVTVRRGTRSSTGESGRIAYWASAERTIRDAAA